MTPVIPSSELLADARRDFPRFYATATAYDEMLLDNLVLTHAALIVGTNTPRWFVAAEVRAGLEKTTDAVERVFTDLGRWCARARRFVRCPPTIDWTSNASFFTSGRRCSPIRNTAHA